MPITQHIIPLLGLALVVILLLLLLPGYLWQRNKRLLQQSLMQSISQQRLSKMLAFLGIKLDDYVSHVPEQLVLQHIRNCKDCPNVRDCDACLRDGHYFVDLHFCPNYSSLTHCSRMMPLEKLH